MMVTGRTTDNHMRFYADGYDWSGMSRSCGPLEQTYEEGNQTTLTSGVQCYLLGQATLGIGTLNGVFDNTETTGLHVLASGAGVMRTVMIPIGIRAAPAQGDPVYMGEFEQKDYQATTGGVATYVTIPFTKTSVRATSLVYDKPWGYLLHAKGAETAVNTAIGIDSETGAATAFGGYLMYQVFAGDGTATIKVQDAATNLNASFADLSGATSGEIDCSTPQRGVVALGTTATVRQFLRWQIVLGTASTVTFALAFCRALR